MKLTDCIINQVLPYLVKARLQNVILGQKDHVRRITTKLTVPDYIQHHAHRHYMPELCYCLKGKFVMHLGQFHYLLKAHDACVIRRNLDHYESFVSPRTDYEVVWIIFDSSVRELIIMHFRYHHKKYERIDSLHVNVPGEFVQHLDILAEKSNFGDIVEKKLKAVCAIIQEKMENPRGAYTLKDSEKKRFQYLRMLNAAGYIMEKYCEDIQLKDVAEYVGLNPNNLERVLRENAGMTFLKFRTSCRMWKALDYFNNTSKNISQIAYDCGFEDPLDFSRVFKKYFGLSPRDFRGKYAM
jgi:AraC-like DNA-binding protein